MRVSFLRKQEFILQSNFVALAGHSIWEAMIRRS
jgi:hypothetical protein